MTFDNNLHALWNSDKSGGNIDIPHALEKLKSAKMPVDKVRRHLRYEFFMQLAAVIIIGFAPVTLKFNPLLIFPFYLLYFIFVLICGYFFTKLFLFYKNMSNTALTSKDNLYAVYYDIKLSIELYKAFTYCLVPFLVLFIGMIIVNEEKIPVDALFMQGAAISKSQAASVLLVLIGVILGLAVVTELYVNTRYGKYAKQVKRLLDEFREG